MESPTTTESDNPTQEGKDHCEALILAERSRKIFVEALLNPPKPNDAAISAAKRFRQEVEAPSFSLPPRSRLPIGLQPRRGDR